MTIKLSQLSDNIRIAVLDGGLTIYFLDQRISNPSVALVSNDKVIGGVILESNPSEGIDWYEVRTLWADSAVATVTLLYAILEHYEYILPSSNISPAAKSVVKRFYNKYKGTEVVIEGTGKSDRELEAGYAWSPKLRKVPVQVGTIRDYEHLRELKRDISLGFDLAYSDPRRTKLEDPDVFLDNDNMFGLYTLFTQWIAAGGSKKIKFLRWTSQHLGELENFNNKYARAILKYYNNNVGSTPTEV
jgi:hypothetical protein